MTRTQTNFNDYTLLGDIYVNVKKYESKLVENPNGCINYVGNKHRQGYGFQSCIRAADSAKIMVTTHRIAARLKYGRAINSNEFVLHTCTDKEGWHTCCNPNHIMIGDKSDMVDIMKAHGKTTAPNKGPRGRQQTGRKYKYTIAEMQWIKGATHYQIVKKYPNLTMTQAGGLKHRLTNGYQWLNNYNNDGSPK